MSEVKVAVVGPAHPFKGGVAAHTTQLAHHLAAAGHDVELVSWSRLYPARLYPGQQAVPDGVPDVPPYPRTSRSLSWSDPRSWWRTGRRLRSVDLLVVVHVVPAVVPAHLTILGAAGARRSDGAAGARRSDGAAGARRSDGDVAVGGAMGRPRTVVVAHNVLPHEPHLGAAQLVRALLRTVDTVLVHSAQQASLARQLGARQVARVSLPPHLPGGQAVPRPPYDGPVRLLALGLVRPYKGVDVLLRALRRVPELRVTVAGEMWGPAGAEVRRLAGDPALAGRVEVRDGYVPADQIASLLAEHDVLALPYRSATASQNALLAFAHGLPVLATRTGTFSDDVRDGVDGVLVAPDDEGAMVAGLRRIAAPGELERLRSQVRAPDLTGPWQRYSAAVLDPEPHLPAGTAGPAG
ncbi:MAG: glycosyltransferase family 4 protein [Angustibacter sp.]